MIRAANGLSGASNYSVSARSTSAWRDNLETLLGIPSKIKQKSKLHCSRLGVLSLVFAFGVADQTEARKTFVQTLWRLARTCGLQAVRDQAARTKVAEVLASEALDREGKQEAVAEAKPKPTSS